jgi:tRNA G18 (ribose-2'-O)-methylase SpoU
MTLNVVHIEDPGDSRIADYANLTDSQLLARALAGDQDAPGGLFMAEGDLVVRQLLRSPMRVRSLLLTPSRIHTMRDVLEPLPADVPIYSALQPVMDRITGFHIHRGVLAAGERPPPPNLGDLLRRVSTLVVLEDLANHDNVGGIFRATAALAGLPSGPREAGEPAPPSGGAVLVSPRTCDPLYRKAIRVSLGAALHVPFARLDPWPDALGLLREAGFTLVALTPDPAAISINELSPNTSGRVALLLGAEGPGLSAAAFAMADLSVRIPMCGPMDSLNVVVAAGIALHRLAPGARAAGFAGRGHPE